MAPLPLRPHSRPSPNAARRILLLGCLTAGILLLAGPAPRARAEKDVDGLQELLPHQETLAERLLWLGREHERPNLGLKSDPPPLAPVRNCAEWEPCSGVLIRYPLGLPYQLLRDLDDQVLLHVVVSSGYYAQAQSYLATNGVDMDRVQFLVKPNDSIWTRDYGPWFVFTGGGGLAIIDHVYNRPWRPNDDLIPIYFAEQQDLPVYHHDMVHTGGNYMTDGCHVSCSTRLVYDEAASACGMSEAEVDQLMADYYGVTTYHVMDYIESGGIHHIDTWGKFLDEETVLVKEVWPAHATYGTLEQRATLLASLPASTGRNYRVRRVYCQDIGAGQPASYTNSLILNQSIYVPLFGSATFDSAALNTYRSAAPGYSVRGYYYSGFLTDDALHCRAKGVMDRSMLRVEHVPLREDEWGPATVAATVHAYSGEPLTSAAVHFRQDGGSWQVAAMSPAGDDLYAAVIPGPTGDVTTEYYILVADGSGRQAGMPRPAPASWYTFTQHVDLTGVGARNREPGAPIRVQGAAPNPFNPRTSFRFELREADHVELDVLDVRGRVVRRLLQGTCPAGATTIDWDGRDDGGRPLAAGTYLFRLRAAGLQYTGPVTLVK
jgi:agmatine deiminase